MDVQADDSMDAGNRGTKGSAVQTQPLLVVGPGYTDTTAAAMTLLTSALTPDTPHVSVTRKLITGRCKSKLLIQPSSPPEPVRPHCQPPASLAPLQLRNRCSSAPAGLKRVMMSATAAPKLPRVLQFEAWWVAAGKRHHVSVHYHTSNGEFCLKGAEEVSLTMHDSSGRQLDHWDLHVGAELDMSGKKIVLKKMHLRHLRDDVAHLAWRLRQHKPVVQLPLELEDLKPLQGPTTWSLPGASLSPNVLGKLQTVDPSLESGTQTSGCSTRRGLTVVRPDSANSQQPYLISLGPTPTIVEQLSILNRASPLACLRGNPLALSASRSRREYSYTPLW